MNNGNLTVDTPATLNLDGIQSLDYSSQQFDRWEKALESAITLLEMLPADERKSVAIQMVKAVSLDIWQANAFVLFEGGAEMSQPCTGCGETETCRCAELDDNGHLINVDPEEIELTHEQ